MLLPWQSSEEEDEGTDWDCWQHLHLNCHEDLLELLWGCGEWEWPSAHVEGWVGTSMLSETDSKLAYSVSIPLHYAHTHTHTHTVITSRHTPLNTVQRLSGIQILTSKSIRRTSCETSLMLQLLCTKVNSVCGFKNVLMLV